MDEVYKQRCQELRKRIAAIEKVNDVLTVCLDHRKQGVSRLRLERAFLYESLEKVLPRFKESSVPIYSPELRPLITSDEALDSIIASPPVKKKDPLAPKRPTNPFIRFCEAERETVRVELLQSGEIGELTKALGQRWQNLDEEQKKPYMKMYEQDKIRYEKEKYEYERTNNEDVNKYFVDSPKEEGHPQVSGKSIAYYTEASKMRKP